MRIIFLDIDGVLNNQLWFVKTKGKRNPDDLDPESIKYLNNLIKETGAIVVVSSVWRLNRTIDELQEVLDKNGFVGTVIGRTLDMRWGKDSDCILRGNEILQWIKSHIEYTGQEYWNYRDYVILDDDTDMLYWQKDNFIWVDPYCGLTPNLVFKAKKILMGKEFDTLKG